VNFELSRDALSYFGREDAHETLRLLSAHYDRPLKPGATLLFLDEIQAAPQVLSYLRYLYEQVPQLHVIAAGSLLEFALQDAAFSMPVGRIEYLHLGPMTFSEFLSATGHGETNSFLDEYTIGQELPVALHQKLNGLFRQYLVVGGMPASIASFVSEGDYAAPDRAKQSILSTYRDDFAKYRTRVAHDVLSAVFQALPGAVGTRMKYAQLCRELRSEQISRAVRMLSMARVVYLVCHSACSGVPLGATVNRHWCKPLLVDVGLLTSASGLSMAAIARAEDLRLVNSGSVTEQFVGQHLLYRQDYYHEPELHFWCRESRSSNAEVDYVMGAGDRIVPVEVKAGATGSLRSLNQFVVEKGVPMGVRFNTEPPSVCRSAGRMPAGDSYDFTLLSLPCYMVEQLGRLIEDPQALQSLAGRAA